MDELDVIREARRSKQGRLTRMDILQTASKLHKAMEKKDYSFEGNLPSWSEIEELFGVNKAECMAEVDAYNDELYDNYEMTVELYLNTLGVPKEDHRDVAEGFWARFPEGAVVGLDGADPYIVLDSEKKQLWGYALAMHVHDTEGAPEVPEDDVDADDAHDAHDAEAEAPKEPGSPGTETSTGSTVTHRSG